MTRPEAQTLIRLADDLLDGQLPATSGIWPRASALLIRQALEAAMEDLWQSRGLNLSSATKRAQLLCLKEYLGNPQLAEEANHTWWSLTRACHHHPYELAPTLEELRNWRIVVRNVMKKVQRSRMPGDR